MGIVKTKMKCHRNSPECGISPGFPLFVTRQNLSSEKKYNIIHQQQNIHVPPRNLSFQIVGHGPLDGPTVRCFK